MNEAKTSMDVCTANKDSLKIQLTDCAHICRYHKYPKRTQYNNSLLAPKGMCVDLFHSAYPHCLSMLYSKAHPEGIIAYCPNPEGNVAVEIKRKPLITGILRRFGVWLAARFGFKIECPDAGITMTVVSDAEFNCQREYKKGKRFKFNIWLGREMCPATFDAVYPSVHNMARGAATPWHSGTDTCTNVACPDPNGNITMEVCKK